jgi:hypothetical protein
MQNPLKWASPKMEDGLATGQAQSWTRARLATRQRGLALAAAALTSSCAILHSATPVERAQELLPKCGHATPELTMLLLSRESMESVEPALSYRITGNDHVMVLRGSLIHLRPVPGGTKEMVQLALECHQARVALGESAPPDDPYVLPGKWADIDVSSDGDVFEVVVSAGPFDDRQALLDRARSYRRLP